MKKKKQVSNNFSTIQKNWGQTILKNQQYQENLLVFPSAGLGNRLRVIAASWNIAEKLKKKVHFYWNVNYDLGCNWQDIFSYPKIEWEKNPQKFSSFVYSSKNFSHVSDHLVSLGFAKQNILYSKKYKGKNINIYSCWLNFPRKGIFFADDFFRLLKPSLSVEKYIKKFFCFGEKKKLGIHIRFTDAPLRHNEEWVLEWVKHLVKKYPLYTIFLACDNQKIKDKILDILPQNRVCYQKTTLTSNLGLSIDRANKMGIQIATADLFALAGCDIFWANDPKSSFFQAAYKMHL